MNTLKNIKTMKKKKIKGEPIPLNSSLWTTKNMDD